MSDKPACLLTLALNEISRATEKQLRTSLARFSYQKSLRDVFLVPYNYAPSTCSQESGWSSLCSHAIAVGSSTQRPAARPSGQVGSSHARCSRTGSTECRGVLTAQSPQRSATRAVPPGAAIACLLYKRETGNGAWAGADPASRGAQCITGGWFRNGGEGRERSH